MSDIETVAEAIWHIQNADPWSDADSRERGYYLRAAQAAIDALGLTPEWAARGPGVWLSREGAAQYAEYHGRKLHRRLVTSWVEEPL